MLGRCSVGVAACCTLATILAPRTGRWWITGLCTVLATATALWVARRHAHIDPRAVAVAAGVVLAVAVILPPNGSHDVWSYAMVGRTVAAHHANPYTAPPGAFPADPILAGVARGWRHTTTPYGPVFVAYAAGVASIAGPHPLLERWGFQLGDALAVALALWLLWRATAMSSALVLLALHPVVSATIVNGGHNDAFVGLAVLAARAARASGPVRGVRVGARGRRARQAARRTRGAPVDGLGLETSREAGGGRGERARDRARIPLERVRSGRVALGGERGRGRRVARVRLERRVASAHVDRRVVGWAGLRAVAHEGRAGRRRAVRAVGCAPGTPRAHTGRRRGRDRDLVVAVRGGVHASVVRRVVAAGCRACNRPRRSPRSSWCRPASSPRAGRSRVRTCADTRHSVRLCISSSRPCCSRPSSSRSCAPTGRRVNGHFHRDAPRTVSSRFREAVGVGTARAPSTLTATAAGVGQDSSGVIIEEREQRVLLRQHDPSRGRGVDRQPVVGARAGARVAGVDVPHRERPHAQSELARVACVELDAAPVGRDQPARTFEERGCTDDLVHDPMRIAIHRMQVAQSLAHEVCFAPATKHRTTCPGARRTTRHSRNSHCW